MFKNIKKRDGRVVKFDSSKITSAISMAGKATGEFGQGEARELVHRVLTLAYELRLEITSPQFEVSSRIP
jgi:anaerobic ribonucleoside-triphosphate reductase